MNNLKKMLFLSCPGKVLDFFTVRIPGQEMHVNKYHCVVATTVTK